MASVAVQKPSCDAAAVVAFAVAAAFVAAASVADAGVAVESCAVDARQRHRMKEVELRKSFVHHEL